MSRTIRKSNSGDLPDKDRYTSNKKKRKWNKEKSIKLKFKDLDEDE